MQPYNVRHALCAGAAGVLLGLSFPSWSLFPLAWCAMALLIVSAHRLSARGCALHFFLGGLVFYLFLLQWLVANVFWAGGWALWGYVLGSALMAAYWVPVGLLWRFLLERGGRVPLAISMAVIWMAMELLQGVLFGWGAFGYSQGRDFYLLQLASVGGVNLLSGIVVACNVLLAQAWERKQRRLARAGAAVALMVVAHLAGWALVGDAEYGEQPFMVGMFQSNFSQSMKWDDEYAVEMVSNASEKTLDLSAYAALDLMVWPEALVLMPETTPEVSPILKRTVAGIGAPLFSGGSRYRFDLEGWTNSSFLMQADGVVSGHYDKVHLAPFGEYLPLGDRLPFLQEWVPVIGDMKAGTAPVVFPVKDRAFGPLICFEVIFPGMSDTLRRQGADFLVVITNLAWFGATNAIDQELEFGRMRAVETRLPLVHCTNTGHSGIFDPYGRFAPVGPAHMRTAGALPLPMAARHPLPWGQTALWWIAFSGTACVIVAGVACPCRGSDASFPETRQQAGGAA
jgi:apolipoprotein N-acyltransferase